MDARTPGTAVGPLLSVLERSIPGFVCTGTAQRAAAATAANLRKPSGVFPQ